MEEQMNNDQGGIEYFLGIHVDIFQGYFLNEKITCLDTTDYEMSKA